MNKTKKNKLPVHVAIIMDGNGRWAKRKKLERVEGHRVGIESVRDIVTATCELQIPYLTLYAFSKENWARPKDEVNTLLSLLAIYLEEEFQTMKDKGIRFNILGEVGDFPKRLRSQIQEIVVKTAKNKALSLNIALSYSGRQEIVRAVKAIVEEAKRGTIKRIDEKTFSRHLYAGHIPDPDLLIRTSGEMRLSNFLLWQLAYTEIYVTDTLWPDFRKKAYLEALQEFARRERRFGKIEGN
jgi:undecaprenyl diphosphate synthase